MPALNTSRAYFSVFWPKLNFTEMLKLNLKTLKLNLKILKLNLKTPKLPNIVNFTPISKYLFWNLVNIASSKFDFSLKYKKTANMLKKKLIKIHFVNAKTQFENAKTQKTAQVLAQVFLDRRSKKAKAPKLCNNLISFSESFLR